MSVHVSAANSPTQSFRLEANGVSKEKLLELLAANPSDEIDDDDDDDDDDEENADLIRCANDDEEDDEMDEVMEELEEENDDEEKEEDDDNTSDQDDEEIDDEHESDDDDDDDEGRPTAEYTTKVSCALSAEEEKCCVCGKRTDIDEQGWVCCDDNDGWYHVSCVKMTRAELDHEAAKSAMQEADAVHEWRCIRCLEKRYREKKKAEKEARKVEREIAAAESSKKKELCAEVKERVAAAEAVSERKRVVTAVPSKVDKLFEAVREAFFAYPPHKLTAIFEEKNHVLRTIKANGGKNVYSLHRHVKKGRKTT